MPLDAGGGVQVLKPSVYEIICSLYATVVSLLAKPQNSSSGKSNIQTPAQNVLIRVKGDLLKVLCRSPPVPLDVNVVGKDFFPPSFRRFYSFCLRF